MQTKVLLSIKPEFANKIFTGEKKYEYRKFLFKNVNVKGVIVYASNPIKKVIGEFEIVEVISDSPEKIWEKTHKQSGISKYYFEKYTNSKDTIYALKIGRTLKYEKQLNLKDDFNVHFAPQSFIYL